MDKNLIEFYLVVKAVFLIKMCTICIDTCPVVV